MPTPSTGPISFSELQNYLGGSTKNLGAYYKGGSVIPVAMGGSDGIPTSGTISFSDLRNKPTDIVYASFSVAPIKGYQGSNGSSAFLTLPIATHYPLKNQTAGSTFSVGVSYDPGSTWTAIINPNQVLRNFTYGTPASIGVQTGSGSKSQYLTFNYNGSTSLVVTCYYCCASSDNKSARPFIKTIQYS